LNQPDWSYNSHTLSVSVLGLKGTYRFHLILNAYWEALTFELSPLPAASGGGWRRLIDTYLDPPWDICTPDVAPYVEGNAYAAQPRSVVFLAARLK
jgi:isoamylase